MATDLDWITEAIGLPDFRDQRLTARLVHLVTDLFAHPEASVSHACGSWAATQAAYRFWHHPSVDIGVLSQSVGRATALRCQAEPQVLRLQDTTEIRPTAPARGVDLGPLANAEARGLWLHTTLAATPAGLPLGLVHQEIWTRDAATRGQATQRAATPTEGKERARWVRGLQVAQHRLGPAVAHVTVADREADIFELSALAEHGGGDFVLRATQNRVIGEPAHRLAEAATTAPVLGRQTVEVMRHAGRPGRTAQVTIRATTVTLQPPAYQSYAAARRRWWADHPEVTPLLERPLVPLTVQVVEVREETPPANTTALHWRLLSSLPAGNLAEATHVVALYRVRWLVERFHFVLKSGCRVERLQLATADRLERAVLTYSLVAWGILRLTLLARSQPQAPCTAVVPPAAWQALHVFTERTPILPAAPPDLATFLAAVGRLGGHLGRTRDGPPGPKTLWNGWRRLMDLTELWLIEHGDPPSTVRPPCV
jgi:hypothetical protein